MSRTNKVYKSFSDLKQTYVPRYKVLTLRPVRRPYLNQSDAVYDFVIGHEFAVSDSMSPFSGCRITVLDKHTLQRHGYTHAVIQYNKTNTSTVEVKL